MGRQEKEKRDERRGGQQQDTTRDSDNDEENQVQPGAVHVASPFAVESGNQDEVHNLQSSSFSSTDIEEVEGDNPTRASPSTSGDRPLTLALVDAYIAEDKKNKENKPEEHLLLSGVVETQDDFGRKRCLIALLAMIISVVLVSALLIAKHGRSGAVAVPVTEAPTFAPTEPREPLDLDAVLGPLMPEPLDQAYIQAFRWIAEVDRSGIREDAWTPEWKLIQRFALAVLYYATDGENWKNQLQFLSDKDECEWTENTLYINEGFEAFWRERSSAFLGLQDDPFVVLFEKFGVRNDTRANNGVRACDDEGRVTAIHIPGNNLNGTLPDVLGGVDSLQSLEFLGNFVLGGTLPASFADLGKLTALNLAYSEISGILPPAYAKLEKIETVLLPFNSLQGTLPSEYSIWTNLQAIDFSDNALTGTLPSEYSMWTNLQINAFYSNGLTGTLPSEYSKWTNLQIIDFSSNALTGTLPSEYSMWTDLQISAFYINGLTGTLPSEYSMWTNLQIHALYANSLTGTLPSEYSMWTKLQDIYFFRNAFTGTLPSEYSMWTNLQIINYYSNALTGTLPSEYSMWTNLQIYSLYSNALTGTLPSDYSTWTDLQIIALHSNALTGTLPSDYSVWTNLQEIYFFDNALTGTLPSEYSMWTNLQDIYFSDNSLAGTLPRDYIVFADLLSIDVLAAFSGNNLEGFDILFPPCRDPIRLPNNSSQVVTGEKQSTRESVWFVVKGTDSVVDLDLCGAGTDFDTVLAVFWGSCNADTEDTTFQFITWDNDSCGLGSSVSWDAEDGVDYYIELAAFDDTTGHFELSVTFSD